MRQVGGGGENGGEVPHQRPAEELQHISVTDGTQRIVERLTQPEFRGNVSGAIITGLIQVISSRREKIAALDLFASDTTLAAAQKILNTVNSPEAIIKRSENERRIAKKAELRAELDDHDISIGLRADPVEVKHIRIAYQERQNVVIDKETTDADQTVLDQMRELGDLVPVAVFTGRIQEQSEMAVIAAESAMELAINDPRYARLRAPDIRKAKVAVASFANEYAGMDHGVVVEQIMTYLDEQELLRLRALSEIDAAVKSKKYPKGPEKLEKKKGALKVQGDPEIDAKTGLLTEIYQGKKDAQEIHITRTSGQRVVVCEQSQTPGFSELYIDLPDGKVEKLQVVKGKVVLNGGDVGSLLMERHTEFTVDNGDLGDANLKGFNTLTATQSQIGNLEMGSGSKVTLAGDAMSVSLSINSQLTIRDGDVYDADVHSAELNLEDGDVQCLTAVGTKKVSVAENVNEKLETNGCTVSVGSDVGTVNAQASEVTIGGNVLGGESHSGFAVRVQRGAGISIKGSVAGGADLLYTTMDVRGDITGGLRSQASNVSAASVSGQFFASAEPHNSKYITIKGSVHEAGLATLVNNVHVKVGGDIEATTVALNDRASLNVGGTFSAETATLSNTSLHADTIVVNDSEPDRTTPGSLALLDATVKANTIHGGVSIDGGSVEVTDGIHGNVYSQGKLSAGFIEGKLQTRNATVGRRVGEPTSTSE